MRVCEMKYVLWILCVNLLIADTVSAQDADRLLRRANRYFAPLPEVMPGAEKDSAEKIALGKKLFFDPRLSINDQQSCSSCHRLENGAAGVDNLPVSPGARGDRGTRNSPSVLNAGLQRRQFWDGRAENLVEQAKGPILNPIEMAMPDEQTVVKKISAIDEYREAFTRAFPEASPAISYHNIAEAIAAFERTLLTPSRFDDFMNGDTSALTEAEQRGMASFIKVNCVSCHDGPLLGGVAFEKLGQEAPYANQADLGMYEQTKSEADKMVFKVAQLRNIALTAPYFHDGSISTLDEAIRQMATLQLGEELSREEVADISRFLHALTDKGREKRE